MKENLNIVDETGKIIGEASRQEIHERGLLHREIHVWLFSSNGDIFFQHRAKDKDTWPDKLDASVGGHVDIGMGWEDTAVKEVEEETGLHINPDDLKLLDQTHTTTFDPSTKTTNNALRRIYALRYDGPIEGLKIEEGKSLGFELWPISKLFKLSREESERFIPIFLERDHLEIFEKIQALISDQEA